MKLEIRLPSSSEFKTRPRSDWRIYRSVLFHFLDNAVKHGREKSTILIEMNVIAEPETQTNHLICCISNLCEKCETDQQWRNNIEPLFAFKKSGWRQVKGSGLGIGISTAHALI